MQSRALYSKAEEELLGTIKSNSNPTLQTFEQNLKENPHIYFPARSAKSVFAHWQLLKQYHLLPDQSVPPLNKNGPVKDFAEAEQQVRFCWLIKYNHQQQEPALFPSVSICSVLCL